MNNNRLAIPSYSKILVIGGGPAGSIASSLLAREGYDVTVLEREKFPRYHIGESLLVSLIPILNFIGVYEKIEKFGFVKKYGAYFRLKQDVKPGHIDFRKQSKFDHSYQVDRSEFDEILLTHAAEQSAKVFTEVEVTEIEFVKGQPISAQWKKSDGSTGTIKFDYVIDASGLTGLIANKYLKNRTFQPNFDNVAVVKYWENANDYVDSEGNKQPGAFFLEALTNGAGWCWAIPLRNNRLSSGVVIQQSYFECLKKEMNGDLNAVYEKCLTLTPEMTRVILDGATPISETKVWNDYSYAAESFAGKNYRLAGDAAGFIDPFFSTGVHLACLGGLSAAATIISVIKGDCTEEEAITFHDKCIRQPYVRYLLTVSTFYKQMRNQKEVVLHGVDGETFQKAFDLIQPIVSGNLELNSSEISNEKVLKTMDFLANMRSKTVEFDKQSFATKLALKELNKHQYNEMSITNRFGAIDGMYIKMQHGKFGLRHLGVVDKLMRKAKELAFRVIWRMTNVKI